MDLSRYSIKELDRMFASIVPTNNPLRDEIAQEIEDRVNKDFAKKQKTIAAYQPDTQYDGYDDEEEGEETKDDIQKAVSRLTLKKAFRDVNKQATIRINSKLK